jgi:hypothetical protein
MSKEHLFNRHQFLARNKNENCIFSDLSYYHSVFGTSTMQSHKIGKNRVSLKNLKKSSLNLSVA